VAFCDHLQVDSTSEAKLNLPLLQFHEDATPDLPLLAVNFDPALVALLRETKYFLLLQIRVPDAAAAVFERADLYRSQIGSLELMVGRGRMAMQGFQNCFECWSD
jgi:dynein heavy chain